MYTIQQAIEFSMLWILVGREARNQPYSAMLGVAWSVRNRVLSPRYWGTDWLSVMTHPDAYTSITGHADPNLVVYPVPAQSAWQTAQQAAGTAYQGIGPDPTDGATHYFSGVTRPYWAAAPGTTHRVNIGDFQFFIAD